MLCVGHAHGYILNAGKRACVMCLIYMGVAITIYGMIYMSVFANCINTLRPEQYDHSFWDNITKYFFLENSYFGSKWLQFVSKTPGDKSALVQVMAWHHMGAKPLPEPMMTQFPNANAPSGLNELLSQMCRYIRWFESHCADNEVRIANYWIGASYPFMWNDDIMTWKCFPHHGHQWGESISNKETIKAPCYWPFVRGIHQLLMDPLTEGQ